MNGDVDLGVAGPDHVDHHIAHERLIELLLKGGRLGLAAVGRHLFDQLLGQIAAGFPDIVDQIPLPGAGGDPEDHPLLGLLVIELFGQRQRTDVRLGTGRIFFGDLAVQLQRLGAGTDGLQVTGDSENRDRIIGELQSREDRLFDLGLGSVHLNLDQDESLVHPAGSQIGADGALQRGRRLFVLFVLGHLVDIGHELHAEVIQIFGVLVGRGLILLGALFLGPLGAGSRLFRSVGGKPVVPLLVEVGRDGRQGADGRVGTIGGSIITVGGAFIGRGGNVPAAAHAAAHHTAHASHAAHHAAHASHAAHHAAAHAAHAHAGAGLEGEVRDRVEAHAVHLAPQIVALVDVVDRVLRGDPEVLVTDAVGEVVLAQNDIQRAAEGDSVEGVVDHALVEGADLGIFFHRGAVNNDVDIKFRAHLVEPVGQRKSLIPLDLDVDDLRHRLEDTALHIGLREERRVGVLLFARLRQSDPGLGIGVEDRRLVGHRDVRPLDRHEDIEETQTAVDTQILVLFPGVGDHSDAGRLNRENIVVEQVGRLGRDIGRQDELPLVHQRVEALHDLLNLALVLVPLVIHRRDRIDNGVVAQRDETPLFELKLLTVEQTGVRSEDSHELLTVAVTEVRVVLNGRDREFHLLNRGVRLGLHQLAGAVERRFDLGLQLGTEEPAVRLGGVHQRNAAFLVIEGLFGALEHLAVADRRV